MALRKIFYFALVLCSAGLLTGCFSSRDERADVVFINGGEVGSLDPSQISDQLSGRVVTALFEGLMRFNIDGLAEPGTAFAPEVSADKLVYTFKIRPEARWSDGKPVRATDYVESWKRFLQPGSNAEYASLFYLIKNAREFNMGTLTDFSQVGAVALDEKTVQITLLAPTPYFLELTAFMAFCPVRVDEVGFVGDKESSLKFKPGKFSTNGAFVIKSWKLNDRIRLEKNPNYWDAANIKVNSIDVLAISNPTTALNLFSKGDVDLIIDKGMAPVDLGEKLRAQPWFHAKPFLGSWFLRFQCEEKAMGRDNPFKDPKIRRAFALCVDRKIFATKITKFGEPPARSLTPPGAGAGYEPPTLSATNVEEARKLLADAGFPDGKGFPAVDYLYPNFPVEQSAAVELQNMWRQGLNVTVNLTKQDYKTYLATQRKLNYHISRSSWVGDYNDPNTFLDCFLADNGNNRTGWKNAAYDSLIAAAGNEPDNAQRFSLFQKAEEMLLNEQCVVSPVYHYVGIQLYRDEDIGGIRANLTDEHPLRLLQKLKP